MNRICSRHEGLRMRLFGKTMAKGEAGFTMVEVLVALAILSITLIPLMGLFTMAPVLHSHREQKLRAGFLAQLRLEQVKNKIIENFEYQYPGDGYNKSSGAVTDFAPPVGDPEEGLFEPSDAEYRYTIVDAILSGPPPLMRDITVTVWHDKDADNTLDSDEQEVELVTRVARRRM